MLPARAEWPGLSVSSGSVSHRPACPRTGRRFRALPDTGQFSGLLPETGSERCTFVRRKANNDDRSPRIDALVERKEVEDHSTSKSTALLKTCSVRLEVTLCAPLGQTFLKKAFLRELLWPNTLVPLPRKNSSTFCRACNELATCRIDYQDPHLWRWHAWQRVG